MVASLLNMAIIVNITIFQPRCIFLYLIWRRNSISQLKENVKEAISKEMVDEVKKEAEKSSKMRFIVPGEVFQELEYV